MTMNARRRATHAKLAGWPGVRAVRRPVGSDGGEFDLYYVRSGPKTAHPVVIVPGGPGEASIALYRGLRKRAAAEGLDVIMVEHRGIGMSRRDDAGVDLPPEALTVEAAVDDIVAVLDDAQVRTATIYGTSYGTYLAAGVGVRHPRRVHAMVLDSPLLSADDILLVRAAIRRLLWDGAEPGTADLARRVRLLVDRGVFTPEAPQLAASVYGVSGPDVLRRQLDLLLSGREWWWKAMGRGARLFLRYDTPFLHEFDLVQRIGFRELNYGAQPDGLPLDPAVSFREMATCDVDFVAEPFDLEHEMPRFDWPTVVLSGARDLTTPPAVAERIAALIPRAVLVSLPTLGHSLIDTKEHAALEVVKAIDAGRASELPSRVAELEAASDVLSFQLLSRVIGLGARAEAAVPPAMARLLSRVLARTKPRASSRPSLELPQPPGPSL